LQAIKIAYERINSAIGDLRGGRIGITNGIKEIRCHTVNIYTNQLEMVIKRKKEAWIGIQQTC